MSRPRSTATDHRAGRSAVAIATVILAAGSLALTALPAQATPAAGPDVSAAATPSADKLGSHDRALLATYRKQHLARTPLKNADRAVPDFATLLIAVRDGRTAEAERALAALGIESARTESAVGYIKANVPFGMVDRVAAIEDVVAVDVDELLRIDEVRPDGANAVAAAGGQGPEAPSAKTSDSNAYMPTRETGSVDFKERNPFYDGRGVTIGVMDTGVDPTHPALETTTTGERKLVDTVAGTDPRNFIDLLFDATWQNMSATAKVSGPVFTDQVRGETWKAPDSADLRIGLRPIQLPQGPAVVPTLVRESDSAVWVDTDLDHDFTDEELLRPYRDEQQVAHFGTDDPNTPVNERIPFTVQVRNDFFPGAISVNVNVITEAHGTHVAGITAANGMFGGRMDGQAPGARLVSMRACHSFGCSSAALTDGMIDLATKHGVDVINMSIGASPEFNDGQSARALVYNRLIDESGVQLFISAGNSGAGVNTVGDPTAADKVVSVGASVSRATWWANYGSQVQNERGIFPFSSRGPREDGGFKPDLTAPGAAVSTVPDWLPNASVTETGYTLPVGYSMMNGTSMASPQATGAAALLLSAARQRDVSATPAELRSALYSSARYNDEVPAVAQGRGGLDVPGAWKYLSGEDTAVEAVSVVAPVCTPLSGNLVTPHTGSGVFNSCAPSSGGQGIGESRTYDVTVTRTSGPDRAVPYLLTLTGNDGTFSAPRTVKLGLNAPTVVKVVAKPASQGVHSALLRIDNPATRAIEQSAMLAVEAATPLAEGGTYEVTGVAERNGTVHYIVAVPEGTTALDVKLDGLADGSHTRWWAFRPTGVSGESAAPGSLSCYSGYLDGNGCDPSARTYKAPAAGVWELVVESRRTTPLLHNPYRLTVTVTE
ncbi:S8 family serine peptidase [Streptomyces sp. Tu 2975]|uniref:S8 family serine peptidase n=1 Tax=Streptomyces sp. Tu 2975 TaxID=2676871 RepID=UPI001FC9CCB7|nr:S8 family serine peptidase [Streptomyces sp. Tu 2975]